MNVENGIVVVDVPCVSCGYNLRTLAATAMCTECGAAVTTSLQTTVVQWGARYLRRIVRAVTFSAWVNTFLSVHVAVCTATMIVLAALRPNSGPRTVVFILMIGWQLAALLNLFPSWSLTRPPPGQPAGFTAWLVRLGSTFLLLVPMIPFIMTVGELFYDFTARPPWFEKLAEFLFPAWIVTIGTMTVFMVPIGIHYARLCKAAGMHRLRFWHLWLTRILTAATLMITSAYVTLFVVEMWLKISLSDTLNKFITILMLCGVIVGALAFIGATILLFVTADRFRRLLEETSPRA